MFVVWVGTIVTALVTIDPNLFGTVPDTGKQRLLNGLITLILFFTVVFANFAEAVAEGRGKAQAAVSDRRDRIRLPVSCCLMAQFSRSVLLSCGEATK